jgi:GT2 family glycosyltransferase
MDVSIVVCTRNRGGRLRPALEALMRIRSRHAFEVLLIDNASTDDTADVIAEACARDGRFRGIYNARVGLGASRDVAWRHARGEVVAFTDDDCYPAQDFVDQLADVFAEHPDVGCVGGRILLHDRDHAAITYDDRTEPVTYPAHRFIGAGELQGANLSVRRAVLEAVGGLDPELGAGTPFACEDIDLVAAAIWAGFPARYDPRPTVRHDHGRLAAQVPALRETYHKGRGAYHAKYIARSDTRLPTLKGWWNEARKRGPRVFRSELGGAVRYLKAKRRYDIIALCVPLAAVTSSVLLLNSVGRIGAARLRGQQPRGFPTSRP